MQSPSRVNPHFPVDHTRMVEDKMMEAAFCVAVLAARFAEVATCRSVKYCRPEPKKQQKRGLIYTPHPVFLLTILDLRVQPVRLVLIAQIELKLFILQPFHFQRRESYSYSFGKRTTQCSSS